MQNNLQRNTVELKDLVKERLVLLNTLLREITQSTSTLPSGKLHITKRGKYTSYYNRENSFEKTGKYIRKSEMPLARGLAQREYNEKLLQRIKHQIYCLSHLKNLDLMDIYSTLSLERQELIIPIMPTDNEYISTWQDVKYSTHSFENTTTEFYTAKGERVRSKSECLIADTLNRFNVPYRYEYPVKLIGITNYHPDFTCLNVRKRKEIVWEHFGLMNNDNYQNNVAYKLRYLTMNDYKLGEDFIFTMETESEPLSTKVVEKMIVNHLL